MRQKLQNSKGYAESPEFLPALGIFIFKKKSVTPGSPLGMRLYFTSLSGQTINQAAPPETNTSLLQRFTAESSRELMFSEESAMP